MGAGKGLLRVSPERVQPGLGLGRRGSNALEKFRRPEGPGLGDKRPKRCKEGKSTWRLNGFCGSRQVAGCCPLSGLGAERRTQEETHVGVRIGRTRLGALLKQLGARAVVTWSQSFFFIGEVRQWYRGGRDTLPN